MENLLDGIRTLDLSRLLPGPLCTLWLARLGAEVVKIEPPGRGDYLRTLPPTVGRINWLWAVLNRGKKSLALDLKRSEGIEVLLRLVRSADVLVESFRPGVMDRLGLGPERLTAENPRLVYASVTGYGADGPWSSRAGHDLNYQALSGLLALTGEPGGRPAVPSAQVADIGGGSLTALSGILAALLARERSGRGRIVDAAMLDGAVSWLPGSAMEFFARGTPVSRGGTVLNGSEPCYQLYPTADGKWLAVAAVEPEFWARLCRALGREDFIGLQYTGPERFGEAYEQIAAVFRTRTRDQWMEVFSGIDACVEPVLEVDEVEDHPQVRARGLFETFHDPVQDRSIRAVAAPFRFEPPLPEFTASYPLLGQHSRQVLEAAGCSTAEIDELMAGGVTQEQPVSGKPPAPG